MNGQSLVEMQVDDDACPDRPDVREDWPSTLQLLAVMADALGLACSRGRSHLAARGRNGESEEINASVSSPAGI